MINTWWQKLNGTKLFTVFLSIYAAVAIYLSYTGSFQPVYSLLAAASSGFLLWLACCKLSKKKKDWKNMLITTLIVFLVWHYGSSPTDLVWIALAMLGAVAAKFFGYYRHVSLLNPATTGLLLATLGVWILEKSGGHASAFVSWWGVNAGGLPLLILIIPWVIFGSLKFRKQHLAWSFLITVCLALLFLQKWDLLKFTFSDATIYFLASIMLSEPKSTPPLPKQQLVAGITAGIAYVALNQLGVSLAELIIILMVNAIDAYYRLKMVRTVPQIPRI